MKLFEKFKKLFTGEKPAAEPPPIPITPGPQKLRWLTRGYRLPARSRVYKKRKPPLIFVNHESKQVSFRAARMHYIHTSMREANEVRRFTRERQLEARAADLALQQIGAG